MSGAPIGFEFPDHKIEPGETITLKLNGIRYEVEVPHDDHWIELYKEVIENGGLFDAWSGSNRRVSVDADLLHRYTGTPKETLFRLTGNCRSFLLLMFIFVGLRVTHGKDESEEIITEEIEKLTRLLGLLKSIRQELFIAPDPPPLHELSKEADR